MQQTCKPFEEMSADDYAAIGLRSGLEVHRQLLTPTKLFCRCPAGRYSSAYDAEVLRHMRPTLSEFGEYDGTALMEKKTKKNIHYRIHRNTVCTYEFDDTPPFAPSEEALDIATELALLLRLNMVDELHIARKQYLDGSIPAGFQRTTILGVDGWIPYQDRRIGIVQLGLEEDSCREVSDIGHDRVYLTDRLGTPLIEVVTAPDMRTPQEVADVGRIIRNLCRSTRKVRTGYGAARQDVNVSVEGGTRIEIKGVPQLGRIPRLVYNEARRQRSLLHIREQLKERGITEDTLSCRHDDVTRIVARTHYDPMRDAIANGQRVRCVVLAGFAGLLNEPTQEHTNFAKEFADRVRVIACLTRLPNLVHSDTASESLYGKDWKRLFRVMRADHRDALVLVWGSEGDTVCACEEIAIRAREATIGIPCDTRQALKDGTNGFERVLPGAERMYPDTDLPPIELGETRITSIQSQLPEYVWDREKRYREIGLTEDIISEVLLSPYAAILDRATEEFRVPPLVAAVVLLQRFKHWRRSRLPLNAISNEDALSVFTAMADGRLPREGVAMVFREFLVTRKANPDSDVALAGILEKLIEDSADEQNVKACLQEVVREAAGRKFPDRETKHRFLMGQLMNSLRGRFSGTQLSNMLSSVLAETTAKESETSVQA